MFRDDYKKAMDGVILPETVRQNITENLQSGNTGSRKKKKNPLLFRLSYAAVACVVVLVAMFVPRGNSGRSISHPVLLKDLSVSADYDEIYRAVKRSKRRYRYTNKLYLDMDDGAAPGATVNEAAPATKSAGKDDYTKTNTQVAGVDEADIIKTDGEQIYSLDVSAARIRILSAKGGDLQQIGTIRLDGYGYSSTQLYLTGHWLTVIDNHPADNQPLTEATVYDVADPTHPQKVGMFSQSGWYEDSRVIGETLYLISTDWIEEKIDRKKPETFVPTVTENGSLAPVCADRIYRYSFDDIEAVYTVVAAVDLKTAQKTDALSVFGRVDTVYCSTDNLLLARGCYYEKKTQNDTTTVTRFTLRDGEIKPAADGRIDGTLLNQYSIDESDGTFRFVTTVNRFYEENGITRFDGTHAKLTVLDENLKETGAIDDVAPGERVYSVRFMGDTAYFVTFRQTDPLFSVDLSDPNNPKIIGALKIPGFSDYLFPYGDGKLLGVGQDADPETGRAGCLKISLFDIHDPANVTESNTVYITDSHWSQALFDPKACYVDAAEGLVGLNCEEPVSDEDVDFRYRVFDFANGGKERFSITGESIKAYDQDGWRINREYNLRGLRIGRTFYVVGTNFAAAVDIDTGKELSRISLAE